jgi:5'-deoxynucleotidase YfbR-like HD superfamily hydrolase
VAVSVEGKLPLESVAAHSWHVADAVLTVGPLAFEGRLNLGKTVALAVLHDKLEMYIGDWDPVGDGSGKGTHAFDPVRRAEKQLAEERAAEEYLSRLPAGAQRTQAKLLGELAGGETDEARAVKALDKLQGLVYVTAKKAGASTEACASCSPTPPLPPGTAPRWPPSSSPRSTGSSAPSASAVASTARPSTSASLSTC